MKNHLLLISFILISISGFSQKEGATTPPPPPPPMDLPDAGNKPLIDELIHVCKYDLLFSMMRKIIVQEYADENNWGRRKMKKVEATIKYSDVSKSVFYNGYASESKEELIQLIAHYEKLSEKELIKGFPKYKYIIVINFENNIKHGCKKAL